MVQLVLTNAIIEVFEHLMDACSPEILLTNTLGGRPASRNTASVLILPNLIVASPALATAPFKMSSDVRKIFIRSRLQEVRGVCVKRVVLTNIIEGDEDNINMTRYEGHAVIKRASCYTALCWLNKWNDRDYTGAGGEHGHWTVSLENHRRMCRIR